MLDKALQPDDSYRSRPNDDHRGDFGLLLQTAVITLSVSPPSARKVTGAGTFKTGSLRKVTATANSTNVFADWTEGGVVVSTSAAYAFTRNADRNLVANFVPNPFTPVAGNYAGLFDDKSGGGVTVSNAGHFAAKVTSGGDFSAVLQESAHTYSLSGQFSPDGFWQTDSIKGAPGLSAALQLSLDGGDEITGTISDGAWSAGWQRIVRFIPRPIRRPGWASTPWLFLAACRSAELPGAMALTAVNVSASGAVSVSGTWGTFSGHRKHLCSGQGQWPLYASLYSKKGVILGWLTFTNDVAATNDMEGVVA